ncbi:uncharacterized protein LOC135944251 [Cloeon dipterum]|uniref:uncharacterized protein LOC135944251 n=1 Tax=Cloeon dipterum TaxID=197152 RepID=UPI00322037DA
MTATRKVLGLLAFVILSVAANPASRIDQGISDALGTDDLLRKTYQATKIVDGKDTIVLLGNTGTGKSTLSKYIRGDPTLRVEKITLTQPSAKETSELESWYQNSEENQSIGDQKINYRLIFTDGDVKIGSNSSHKSKTLVPNVDVDSETGIHIVDCAGFTDTRGSKVDLAAAYFNKKLLDSSRKVKIVIVENYANLKQHGSRDSFPNTLKYTANLIGENLDELEGSMGLVVTKVERMENIKTAFTEVKQYLSSTLKHLEEIKEGNDNKEAEDSLRKARLLEYLRANVQLFLAPQSEKLEPDERNRKILRKFVFDRLNFSKPFSYEFQATVAAETKIYIRDELSSATEAAIRNEIQKLQDHLTQYVGAAVTVDMRPANLMTRNAIAFCSNFLNAVKNVNNLEQLLMFAKRRIKGDGRNFAEVQFQLENAKFFYQLIGRDFTELETSLMLSLKTSIQDHATAELNFASFLDGMVHDFGNYKPQVRGGAVEKEIERVDKENFIDFASNLRNWGFSSKTARIAASLTPTDLNLQFFNKLASEFQIRKAKEGLKNGSVMLFSRFLVLSQIKQRIEQKGPTEGEFVVMASEKIFVDCNLEVQHAHLKFIAPIVYVVKENTYLRLKGEHAKEKEKARSCNRGNDFDRRGPLHWDAEKGEPGHDGYSSGNLAILALEVQNGGWLTVISEGGDGGRGQDGGDGCDAIEFNAWNDTNLVDKHCGPELICTIETIVPTDGQAAGKGGLGALAGTQHIMLKTENPLIKTRSTLGKQGTGGRGGFPGGSGRPCQLKQIKEMDPFDLENIFTFGMKMQVQTMALSLVYLSISAHCNYALVNASKGPDGLPSLETNSRKQKFHDSDLFGTVLELRKYLSSQNLPLVPESGAGRLLKFYFNSDKFVTQFSYTSLLEAAEIDLEAPHNGHDDAIKSQLLYYSIILESVRQWREIHRDHKTDALEMELSSLLDTLRTYNDGKQVVRLAELVEWQLHRLNDVGTALRDVSKYELVDAEKKSLAKTIEAAAQMIEKVQQRNFEGMKRQADEEFRSLLEKFDVMRFHHIKQAKTLAEHRKEVERDMIKNIGLSIVNVASILTGLFFPPAALVGPTVSGIVHAAVPQPKELQYTQHVERIKLANVILQNMERQKKEQRENMIHAMKAVAELDATDKFLSDKNRETIQRLIVRDAPHVAIDFQSVMDTVDLDFASKIGTYQPSSESDYESRIKKFETSRQTLRRHSVALGTAAEIGNTYLRYSNDKAKLNQIDDVIEKNLETLKDLGEYEQNLHKTFKPLVEQMLQTFKSTALELTQKNSFELLFQKLELKQTAKAFISLLQKVTQDFFAKDEGFSIIVTDLLDVLTTLVDAYEQIEQLRFRIKLFDFLGKISGVQCSTEDCNSLEKTSQRVKLRQLVREFGFVYSAYRQVSFPFGTGKVQAVVDKNILELFSAPKERVVTILKNNLEQIRDVLKAEKTQTDKKDADVIKTEFSMLKSTNPFYTWRHSEYETSIKKLLQGEQITLDASVWSVGVRNAVKANWVTLNITSEDEKVAQTLRELLDHFHLEMVRGKRSYYRCGAGIYAVSGEELNLTLSFETNRQGNPVSANAAVEKLNEGNVPLSPYVLWKFRLRHESKEDPELLFRQLGQLAPVVDLHLVGKGSYVNEGADVCNTLLSKTYELVGTL